MKYSFKEKIAFINSLLKSDMWILIPKVAGKFGLRMYHSRFIHDEYAGRKLLTKEETSDAIVKLLSSDKPAMISRMGGGTELTLIDQYLKAKMGFTQGIPEKYIVRLHNLSGVFPESREITNRFCELYLESMKEMDLCGLWFRYADDYIMKRQLPNAEFMIEDNIEPYYSDHPWTRALAGKKVVVIHPFENTIRAQYEKRESLFENPEMLPKFDLRTVRAAQSIAGNKPKDFNDWFEALEYMYREAMKEDFDVALIGCGAYGVPLAAKLKKAGKKTVVLAGALQLLFGIKGSRWDNMPEINRFYNDAWVRPMDSDKPENFKIVENGCYW